MAQDGSTFRIHRNHICLYYTKEPFIFPYLCHYHSTPSLFNIYDTDSYQDISSNSPQHEADNPFESFNPHSSIETIPQPKAKLHSSSTCQNLSTSTSLNDNLDNTFDSTNYDFKMLQNTICHSISFPQFCPRVVGFRNLSF